MSDLPPPPPPLQPPLPPLPPPRQYATRGVILGAVAEVIGAPLLTFLLIRLGSVTNGNWLIVVGILTLMLWAGPVVGGILLIAVAKRPLRRGFGLGLLIGWGLVLILGAGLCYALLIGLGG